MTIAVPLDRLLAYSDHERAKWREWIAEDASRVAIPFQPGGRFPTIGSLFDHIFLVERRHLARLQGGTPPESTGVPAGDWVALFNYAGLVRADMRHLVETMTDDSAADPIVVTVAKGAVPMRRRTLATHIVLHEIRHLAQIAFAARLAGHAPPGEHDLFYFMEFA
jgi:uncharacterized damage-inducible protein DinB